MQTNKKTKQQTNKQTKKNHLSINCDARRLVTVTCSLTHLLQAPNTQPYHS